MPEIEDRTLQKELDSRKFRPVYWLYGEERLKIRELLRRIEKNVFEKEGINRNDFNWIRLDGAEVSFSQILDQVQSYSWGGGKKVVVVTNAAEVAGLDSWPTQWPESDSILVMISTRFVDRRLKWTKLVVAQAALTDCVPVPEDQREVAIGYLARRHEVTLTENETQILKVHQPWFLEGIEQELEKLKCVADDRETRFEALVGGVDPRAQDEFINAFFNREFGPAAKWVRNFGEDSGTFLMLLGLIAWNLRQLKGLALGSNDFRHPLLRPRLERWKLKWSFSQIQKCEQALAQADSDFKGTGVKGPETWTQLLLNLQRL